MGGRLPCTLVVVVTLVTLGAAQAFAGGFIDPNAGDDFVGKAGGLRYSQDSQLAESGAPLLAGCGSQAWRLLGAGETMSGSVAGSFLSFGRGWDYTDPDDDLDDGWYTGGQGPPGTAVSATAICRKQTKIRYLSEEVPPGSQLRTADLGCGGPGWHVTTGSGFLPTSNSWINSSYPIDGKDPDHVPDDGWRVRLFSAPPSGFSFLFVMCARKLDLRYESRKATTLGTSNTAERTGTQNVGCGKRGHVIGGGAKLGGLINRARLFATVPADSGDAGAVPDDRWHSGAYNLGGTPITQKGFAICLRP